MVRIAQNALISHIITILQEIVKLRFESLLVLDDFVMIWGYCDVDAGDIAVYTENKLSGTKVADG